MKDGTAGSSSVYVAGGLALGAAASVAFWQHYNDNVAAPPRLWLADGPLKERVLLHCSALLRPFAPTPWAANRHAQTVLGFMRGLTLRGRYNRQLILAVDGATLGLDWFDGCDAPTFPAPPDAPVLIVCHGINGGSHEGYAKWACAAAVARGWRAVVLNYRGCNGLPFTAPRGYAATMSHDVFTAVYSVKARFPAAPLLAVGYSLGGLKLTKYLAEADAGLHMPPPSQPRLFSGSGLAAAAVVSSPVDVRHSANKLSDRTSISFLYNLAVAYKLREHIAKHRADIAAHTRFDVDGALNTWTVGDIEDSGLAASLGFRDRLHYYEEVSSPDYIPAITTPTLLLLAEDDPFLGVVPDVECSRNPATLLALTRRGGHVAFLQGAWPLGRSYMEDAVLEFFAATLEHLDRPPQPPSPRGSEGGGFAAAAAAGAGGASGTGAAGPVPAAAAAAPTSPAVPFTAAAAAVAAAPPPPLASGSGQAGQGAPGGDGGRAEAPETAALPDAVRAGALAAAYAASGNWPHRGRSGGGGSTCGDLSCHGGEHCTAHQTGHPHAHHHHPLSHDHHQHNDLQHQHQHQQHRDPLTGRVHGAAAGTARTGRSQSPPRPAGQHAAAGSRSPSRGNKGSAAAHSGLPANKGSKTLAGSAPPVHGGQAQGPNHLGGVGERRSSSGGAPAGQGRPGVATGARLPPPPPPSADLLSEQLKLLLVLQQQLDQEQRARTAKALAAANTAHEAAATGGNGGDAEPAETANVVAVPGVEAADGTVVPAADVKAAKGVQVTGAPEDAAIVTAPSRDAPAPGLVAIRTSGLLRSRL